MLRPETNQARIETASMFLKKVGISLVTRRPVGLSAIETDGALSEVQLIVARLAAITAKLKAGERKAAEAKQRRAS